MKRENKNIKKKKRRTKKSLSMQPTGAYVMDTITMRQKIMEQVMLMEENQLKMWFISQQLETKIMVITTYSRKIRDH